MAEELVQGWYQSTVSEYLWIVDPYFRHEDLAWIKLLVDLGVRVPVTVLGILAEQRSIGKDVTEIAEAYQGTWRSLTDESLPMLRVVLMSCAGPPYPIHGRYLFTQGGGLAIDTSLGGLGGMAPGSIRRLGVGEGLEAYDAHRTFFDLGGVEHLGKKVHYQIVTV
jgi:hypothetical protein